MILRIQGYNIEVVHIPGKDVPLADTLCRVTHCEADTIEELDVSVQEIHSYMNASKTHISQIREERL